MANTSILAAFERMWEHIVLALSGKSDISHIHEKYEMGLYVNNTTPTNSSEGDIWIDTEGDPSFIAPNIPAVTTADNGKVLMVVNGAWQAVDLNLSIDENGIVSV